MVSCAPDVGLMDMHVDWLTWFIVGSQSWDNTDDAAAHRVSILSKRYLGNEAAETGWLDGDIGLR